MRTKVGSGSHQIQPRSCGSVGPGIGGDQLYRAAGNDSFSGGVGADLFVFSVGSGRDPINSLVVGVEHFVLNGVTDAVLKVTGTRAIISFGRGDVISPSGLTDVQTLTLDRFLI